MYPDQAKCDGAQLTARGFYQHAKAGMYLAKKYIYKRKLFRGKLNQKKLRGSIYARTTYYSRTYQSAWAFLFGFLSNITAPGDLNVLTESYSTSFCSSQLSGVSCLCPAIKRVKTTLEKEHSKIVNSHSFYKSVKKEVGKVLGVPVSSTPWLGAVLDVLMAYWCHNHQLPCVSKTGQCFTPELVHNIWKVTESVSRAELETKAKLKVNDLMMYPLLREIANRYVNITKGLSQQKVVLYSGHDKTISPLLVAMGIGNGQWPPFASRLVMELYSSSNASAPEYYLKVIYNGNDMTRQLRFCENGLCPLENFLDFVFNKYLSAFGKGTYNDICTKW